MGDLIRISREVISVDSVVDYIASPACGAESLFLGAVREKNQGKPVLGLEYEAQDKLAANTISTICSEARSQWGEDLKIAVVHRVGKLKVGELSVAIGVSSPHRDEACSACRYVIEELKHRVPIWKKEHYAEGESDWLEGCSLCVGDS
jgi:molybdopterin synthase catalytic subunit